MEKNATKEVRTPSHTHPKVKYGTIGKLAEKYPNSDITDQKYEEALDQDQKEKGILE